MVPILLGALTATGCADPTGGVTDEPRVVGETIALWTPGDASEGPDLVPTDPENTVGPTRGSYGVEVPVLLPDATAYDDWLETVPSEGGMRAALTVEPELEDSVLLAFRHSVCHSHEVAITDGAGRVTTVSRPDDPDQQIACAWSPMQVGIFHIELDDLGVAGADEVELADEL